MSVIDTLGASTWGRRARSVRFERSEIQGQFADVVEFAGTAPRQDVPMDRIRRSSGFPVGSDTLQQGVITETVGDAESALTSPNETL